ncbi:MAG: Mrp/NBP35 family ATP-binding protein [Verrucomicrobia bacterium]|nr:Mrp/NBP35 family ATP-binding protein [Verrucomicrobiota bacterium]
MTESALQEALKSVKYPGYSRDIVSFGLVKQITTAQGAVSVRIELTSHNKETAQQIKAGCEQVLRGLEGVQAVHVEVQMPPASETASPGAQVAKVNRLPGIRRVIAVASGKGGVGKSTCSVNLACGLHHLGLRVGLLDCDIYGPSIPLMMGIHQRPSISEREMLVPPSSFGIKLMSMGFLIDDHQPVIWRGPMIMKTVQQFLTQVEWGQLDVLLVDLPPGTGDAQLSLCQSAPLDGGVIVTTPQEASLGVVRKGMAMFDKVHVPILGLIENMSYFITPAGDRVEIFGHGGGRAEAERQKVAFLGEVPIFTEIRVGGDQGRPVTASDPTSPPGAAFLRIAEEVHRRLDLAKDSNH